MDEQNMGGGVWRPITLTDKATGRSVNISILDREFYLSGLFTFQDLWEMYETPSDGEEAWGDDGQ